MTEHRRVRVERKREPNEWEARVPPLPSLSSPFIEKVGGEVLIISASGSCILQNNL